MLDKKQVGAFGENIACEYLKKKGYLILARNYIKVWDDKLKGEIDIIAKRGGVISFVEVKAGLENDNFSPEEHVDFKKQRKLIKLAQSWLMGNRIPLESNWQIDVISVVVDRETEKAKINHFENVVSEY